MTNVKTILKLALPSLLSFATVTATGTINLILVGKMGALVIAAVGVSNIIMYNVWALCSGLGLTVNYLVAQDYGANEMRRAVQRTYMALITCAALAVVVVLLGTFTPEPILRLLGGSPELVEVGAPYLQLRFYAIVFAFTSFVLQGFLRGIGDTTAPMVWSILGNLVMVLFTYAFTYGHFGMPEIGLPGAGWGILLGEVTTIAGVAYVFFFRLHARYRTRTRVRMDKAEARLLAFESGKLGIQEFAMSVAMFVFTAFVTRLGTEALAANEIALNVMSFGFMPAFAFGATATILVGQHVGRGNPVLARRVGTETAVIGTIFILLLGALEFVFAAPIGRLYTDDPQVAELVTKLIRVSAFLQVFDGIYNFYAGGLRGLGDTSFLVKASFLLNWLLFVPLAYLFLFVFGWHSTGAWLALYIFLTAYGLVTLIRFYRTDWSSVTVKQAGH